MTVLKIKWAISGLFRILPRETTFSHEKYKNIRQYSEFQQNGANSRFILQW
jgi:hypothetical protein